MSLAQMEALLGDHPLWEPTLFGGERHLDDGPLRKVHPKRPWASVWSADNGSGWCWGVWPKLARAQMITMEQRRFGVGRDAENGHLARGAEQTLDAAIKAADAALELAGAR